MRYFDLRKTSKNDTTLYVAKTTESQADYHNPQKMFVFNEMSIVLESNEQKENILNLLNF